MNTGQMLLTVGALVLLGTTVLTVNRSFNQQGFVLEQTEIGVYAVSLATSIVEVRLLWPSSGKVDSMSCCWISECRR